MPVTHEPWLVALSIIVAIQGAYVGLSLAVQIGDAVGMRRRLLLAGAAFSLGVAVWAMHFVGMLAARLSFPIDYLVFPTLLSFLVCVIVVGAAVYATSSGPLTLLRLILKRQERREDQVRSRPPGWRSGWRPAGEGARR